MEKETCIEIMNEMKKNIRKEGQKEKHKETNKELKWKGVQKERMI